MFYCDDCAKENGYPTSIMKSVGPCECCGKQAACNDVPSSKLPKRNFVCDTETSGLNPITSEKLTMKDIHESSERIERANYIVGIGKVDENGQPIVTKGYSVINVPSTGRPQWYGGAYTLAFVYSRYQGNFILKGYHTEVEEYLKKNYRFYFVNYSLWSHGENRDIWDFWKDSVGIFRPSKKKRDWKIQVRPYSGGYGHQIPKEELAELTFKFKRLPKRWIPEFNKL